MKKTFKYISVSILLLATLAFCVCAAPSLAGTADSAAEFFVETEAADSRLMAELSGGGTQQSPYLITSAQELFLMAESINSGKGASAYYVLTTDIDLGGAEWTPIGHNSETPFSGHFDGNGHTVSNIKTTNRQYAGLFGYVLNGTVTELGIKNFKIEITTSLNSSSSDLYVGSLAGQVMSSKGTSSITKIAASDVKININTNAAYLYVGGIAGRSQAKSVGNTSISDSYALVDIEANNSDGYNYAGGIVGRLDTNSGSLSTVENCYTTGSISSTSYHSSRAGGIAGYIFSYGSSYSPEVGSLSSEKETATLAATEDVDIMISNSFAVTNNVYSLSTKYSSSAGYIVGEYNTHADVQNVFYPTDANVEVKAEVEVERKECTVNETGTKVSQAVLKDADELSEKAGFDFENVWGISESINGGYPYHLWMHVTLDIGEKQSADNIRYYEIDGNQYEIQNDDNTFTVYPKNDMFIEITEKESADSIYAVGTKYYFVDFETFSYTEITGLGSYMNNEGNTTIRTSNPLGIRFKAKISTRAKEEETGFAVEEYGYIVGVKSELDEAGAQLNFDFAKYVTGVAYKRGTDLDKIFDSFDDDWCVFTGVLRSIPEKNYTSVVTSKTYTKISVNGEIFTVYGEPVNASMYDVAKSLVDSDEVSDDQRAELEKIIEVVEKAEL